MGTWKDCVRGMLANLVQVEGESLERYFKRTRQLCSEGDLDGEDDMRWVVKGFINGLVDDQLHSAMRAARRRNRSMTLGQAYKELKCLRSPGNVPNSGCISGPELAAKAEISVDELSAITLIPVSYMSPDILSDPVAFSQFFISHRARPFYQSSGPFSRQSIQELHAAYYQPTPTKCGINAGAANPGPAVTIGEARASYALSSPDPEPTQAICAMVPADNSTGYRSEGIGETDMYSQSSETGIPGNELTIPDLWAELPLHDDLTMGDPSIAGNEDIADEAQPAAGNVPLGTADFEPDESRIPENELTPPGLWVELPFGDELTVVSSGIVANKPLAVNAQSGACEVALRAVDYNLGVSGNAGEHKKFYQNATGEKEVEKWREKDTIRKSVEKDKDASMMVSGMERRNYLQDLAGMAMNEGVEQEVDTVNREGTADERESSGGPHCSEDLTIDAIQNPSVLSIRTASEWDPGPGKSTAQVDAQNTKDIVVKTMSREPLHPVAEYLWPPEFRTQQAHHRIPIPAQNTRFGQHCLSPWSRTTRATGVGSISYRNGSISGSRRKFIQGAATTGTSNSAQSNPIYALYYIGKTGRALRSGPSGRWIWDPGGGRAESQILVGREEESGAGENALEGNELGELAGRQAFGF